MNISRNFHTRMFVLLIAASVLLAGYTSLSSISIDTRSTNPLSIVDTFHSAVNSGNVEAISSLFAEDAVVVDNGSVIDGKSKIRTWVLYSQRMAGLHLTRLNSKINGEKISWYDMAHNGPEVDHIIYLLHWEATIHDGKIQSISTIPRYWPDLK